jgi:hypothetical protein
MQEQDERITEEKDMHGEPGSMATAGSNQPADALREALSERLIHSGALETWSDLFLSGAFDTIRFESVTRSLLVSDDPLDAGVDPGLLAKRLGATAQPSVVAGQVLAFPKALSAVRSAIVIQRLAPTRRLRSAVSTFQCDLARFELGGRTQEVLFGPVIEQAEAALAQVAAGTIAICPATYGLLGDRIGDQAPEAMIATESANDRVTQAFITLPPQRAAAMSTFAGIGLA